MAGEEGRKKPIDFSPELFDNVCAEIAKGLSLRTICSSPEMPERSTIYLWLRTKPELVNQYARAKEDSADALIEDMQDIADDATNDFMTVKKGDAEYEIENKEWSNRSKLRVETRKWIASKLKPKKYGEKFDVTSDYKKIESLSVDELAQRIAAISAKVTEQKDE
jgi:hypothetical protein